MNRLFLSSALIFFFVLFLHPVNSSPQMTISDIGVKPLDRGEKYTTYSWKVDIYSDKGPKTCALTVSLRDSEGYELDSVVEFVRIQPGPNHFTGQGMCKTRLWDQVSSYHAQVNCF